jgi:hypothetical protein
MCFHFTFLPNDVMNCSNVLCMNLQPKTSFLGYFSSLINVFYIDILFILIFDWQNQNRTFKTCFLFYQFLDFVVVVLEDAN